MGRRLRKNKQTAKVGWVEVRNSLRWTLLLLWRVVSLARYLNPLRYLRHGQDAPTAASSDTFIFQPSAWERFLNAFRNEATIRQKLLDWAQDQLPTFKVVDFGSTWCDGVVLCALLESACPGSCPRYDLLKPNNSVNNCRLGLKLAHRYLSIPQTLVTAEEMAEGRADDKVRRLVQYVRWAASQRGAVSDVDWARTNRPMRAPDGSLLKVLEPCLAKGGGLVNGVVGKRCKFNLFIADSTNLNLEIDIRGEKGDSCSERIKREGPEGGGPGNHRGDPRGVGGSDPHSGRDARNMRSLWMAFSRKSLFGTLSGTTTRRALVRQTSVVPTDPRADRKTRIPLDYQTLGDNHLLISYIPRSAGGHRISVRWHGEPIPGSPFTAQVAESVDNLVTYRTRTYQKQAPKEVAFKEVKEADESEDVRGDREGVVKTATGHETKGSLDGGGGNEGGEPAPVQAAILGHTSTVHRSLSCSSPALGGSQTLTKQATITRRRVLRRVIARAGKEIVIHEAPPSTPPSDPQKGLKKRMGSPSPIDGSSFDSPSDWEQASRPVTPTPDPVDTSPAPSQRGDLVGVKKDQYAGDTKVKGSKSAPRPLLAYRRYNSDSSLSLTTGNSIHDDHASKEGPLKPNAHRLLSVPIHDDHFKSSPFLPTNAWDCDDLSGADMKEKLLEGGFITQMSLNQNRPDRIESDSTLDSDSDVVSQKEKERPSDSDSFVDTGFRVINHATEHFRGANRGNERGVFYNSPKAARRSKNIGLSSDTSMSQDSMDDAANDLRWQFSSDRAIIDKGSWASRVKKPVSKTCSDPSAVGLRKRLGPQRSNTSPVPDHPGLSRQRSVDQAGSSSSHGSDSPSLVLLQSDSLRKSCFYISQKAITDSIGDLPTRGATGQPAELEAHREERLSEGTEGEKVGEGPQSAKDKAKSETVQKETQKISETGAMSSQNFRQRSHRSLTGSISLPTLSRQWRAFELEPDANIDSIDEMTVVDSFRKKPKRATLGSCELASQLQDFQKLVEGAGNDLKEGSVTSTSLKEDSGKFAFPKEDPSKHICPKESLLSHVSKGTSNAFSNTCQQTQRGPLQRQEVHQHSSSSDSMSALKTSSNEHESSDKENETPNNRISSSNQFPNNKKPARIASRQTDSLKPTACKPVSRFRTQQTSVIKIPKVKVDRTTQVSYCEIKAETGWVRPNVHLRQKKKAIKKDQPLSEQVYNAPNKESDQASTSFNTLKDASKSIHLTLCFESDSGLNSSPNGKSELLARDRTPPLRPGELVSARPGSFYVPTSRPVRQSTVDTVDSGIAIANEPALFRTTGRDLCWSPAKLTSVPTPTLEVPSIRRPHYISGHRVVTRRQNRRRVAPDPKLFLASPSASNDEDSSAVGSPSLSEAVSRAAGLIQAVCRFSRNNFNSPDPEKRLRSKRIGPKRKRVMFSRRVMMHRRSSSRGSSRGSRTSQSSESFNKTSLSFTSSNFLTVDACRSRSRSEDEEETREEQNAATSAGGKKSRDKREDIQRWLESSPKNMSLMSSSSDDLPPPLAGTPEVGAVQTESDGTGASEIEQLTSRIGRCNENSNDLSSPTDTNNLTLASLDLVEGGYGRPVTPTPSLLNIPPPGSLRPDAAGMERPGSSLSQTGSTDDPAYCGFGVSPVGRQGLLEELNAFSTLTSPEFPCSRRTSLKDGGPDQKVNYINDRWGADATVLIEERTEENESPYEPATVSSDGPSDQELSEIRSLLYQALSGHTSPVPPPLPAVGGSSSKGSQQDNGTSLPPPPWEQEELLQGDTEQLPEADLVSSSGPGYLAARPANCSAFGTGLAEGVVGLKNNFQVETALAGNGTLTVGITGPRPHTVTETNVTYTGDDIYDVIYDVTQPGYYVITIKWSDISIPGSPFVCKVSY